MTTVRDQHFWDAMYRSRDRLFSGAPNGVLVTEAADLPPGHALDLGCGEGGDALWLAHAGWHVTAVDISPTALQRAAAADTTGRITWTHADLTTTAPQRAAYDLVSAQYFPLPRHRDHTALRALLDAVAPGGTLLVAGHDPADLPPHHHRDVDPDAYYHPADIAQLLDPDWTIQINETRPRTTPAPAGTHHTHDTVLRAHRPH